MLQVFGYTRTTALNTTPRLNSFGLLKTLDDAVAFREV
jgi:hypothetical protein